VASSDRLSKRVTSVALAGKVEKLEWVGVLGIGHQVEHRLIR
jgi:hypothetical protein